MKKVTRNQKTLTNLNYMNLVSKFSDKAENVALDILNPVEKEEIERRLREIDGRIEDIGKICDKKKQKSYEDYNNILKSNKSQFMEELTKLNFKLMEAIMQNTREDFLQKLRKDLAANKNQVREKDKELQGNNNKLYVLENKVSLLQEEKDFISKELSHSKQYNKYLKKKLKELEQEKENAKSTIANTNLNANMNVNMNVNNIISPIADSNIGNPNYTGSINLETKTKNESFNSSSRVMKTSYSPQRNKEKEMEKLDLYFARNENILVNKINYEERLIKEKYAKFKILEAFKNPILETLKTKTKEYQFNQMNSKVSNQEVFFNVPEHDLSNNNRTSKRRLFRTKDDRSFSWDYGLSKADKKEIIKFFLDDPEVKKYIYDCLFDK